MLPLGVLPVRSAGEQWSTSVKSGAERSDASAAASRPHPAKPASDASDAATAAKSAPATQAEPPSAQRPDIEQRETAARQYCKVVMDRAVQLRIDSEREEVLRLGEAVSQKLDRLDKAIAEHARWVEKREAFRAEAQDSLVKIYAAMRSEAAAARLAAMDDRVAAAIVARMPHKAAGAVLGEMDQAKAARLASYIAGAADLGVLPREGKVGKK